MSTAHEANTAFSAKVRKDNHSPKPELHPHLDPNSLSTRLMLSTGYRPTNADFIALMVNDARVFNVEELAALVNQLLDLQPESAATN